MYHVFSDREDGTMRRQRFGGRIQTKSFDEDKDLQKFHPNVVSFYLSSRSYACKNSQSSGVKYQTTINLIQTE